MDIKKLQKTIKDLENGKPEQVNINTKILEIVIDWVRVLDRRLWAIVFAIVIDIFITLLTSKISF